MTRVFAKGDTAEREVLSQSPRELGFTVPSLTESLERIERKNKTTKQNREE